MPTVYNYVALNLQRLISPYEDLKRIRPVFNSAHFPSYIYNNYIIFYIEFISPGFWIFVPKVTELEGQTFPCYWQHMM